MGISNIEILDSDGDENGDRKRNRDYDNGDRNDSDNEFDDLGEFGDAQDRAPERNTAANPSPYAAYAQTWRRWLKPPNAPVIASLLAVVLVAAAAAFAAVQKNRSGDDFGVSLISAQYTIRQDASGIDLTLALQNTGSTMIELTGVSVYQPGLIRLTQTGDAAGVTETEAGATTASALGPGTAIASTALTPKDVEEITVPFRYDCGVTNLPPVSHSLSLAGFSARGTARTAQLTLPTAVTPWQGGNAVRSALCSEPTPESNVDLTYSGQAGTPERSLGGPIRYTFIAVLTASGPSSVTISSLAQDNPGIATLVTPALPITLIPGESASLTVTWYVRNCIIATSAHSADGVKMTATARQTVQTWDATLGGRFTTDLASGISTACSGG